MTTEPELKAQLRLERLCQESSTIQNVLPVNRPDSSTPAISIPALGVWIRSNYTMQILSNPLFDEEVPIRITGQLDYNVPVTASLEYMPRPGAWRTLSIHGIQHDQLLRWAQYAWAQSGQ